MIGSSKIGFFGRRSLKIVIASAGLTFLLLFLYVWKPHSILRFVAPYSGFILPLVTLYCIIHDRKVV